MGYVYGFIVAVIVWVLIITMHSAAKKRGLQSFRISRSESSQEPSKKKPGLRVRRKPEAPSDQKEEVVTPPTPPQEPKKPESKVTDYSSQNLVMANLSHRDLRGASFRGSNLTMANLSGSDLRDADLSYCNLTMANLHGTDLRGARLTGARMTMANLADSKR